MRFRDWLTFGPMFFKYIGRLPISHLLYLARKFRNENPHRHMGRVYVNTFFPPYPSSAFDRFVQSAVERKRIPYSTYIAVTDQCPFNCPHCSYGKHIKGRLDTTDALNIIEQIKSIGTITVGFTGGEPLLRDDITELVAATGDDTASIMFTTGHSLDSNKAKQLKAAGLDCLMIGLESDDPAEHDKTRGMAGSFDQAIEAIRLSQKAGIYTAISTVGTKEKINTGKIEKLAELAERLAVMEFRVLEPVPTGSFTNQTDEILTETESKQLSDFHKQWNRKNRGASISAFSYLESDEMFGCGAGFHHLFIDALGNVCPCDLTPLSFGNILEEPLLDIWLKLGMIFGLPRCGCFMKEVCANTEELSNAAELPLPPEKSIELCKKVCSAKSKPGKIPGIYKNLLKGRTPVNPPSSQQ